MTPYKNRHRIQRMSESLRARIEQGWDTIDRLNAETTRRALKSHQAQRMALEMRARTKSLMRPGKVERLVAQGRTPRLFGEPPVLCQIPPEGIQPGDTVALAYPDDMVLEFFSPGGESRGRETSVHVTPRQASKITERIQRATETSRS